MGEDLVIAVGGEVGSSIGCRDRSAVAGCRGSCRPPCFTAIWHGMPTRAASPSIWPLQNPTSTAIFKSLLTLKTRNALVCRAVQTDVRFGTVLRLSAPSHAPSMVLGAN